ncbi:cytochrome P450 [Chryseobacterium ginsenosidimutans]|uniref:cytochrome P450 n=1 Tax=Chryseobacterium ginsenosidimutans TaxID=687846 RepID=UPI002780259B|nr:cytochrome P450 [Chryseobacterium ginsenosidimutans]MDQ0593236.1 cytochrome P450 [Chryseobacterium ginsenosidimutans]
MIPKFNYPKEIKGKRKLYSLLKGLNNPLEVISGNHLILGDNYHIKANFTNKNFIFSQDKEFTEYILKQNHKNYYKSEIQSVTLGKYLGNGLLTNNGKVWLKQRRLIQPGFSKAKIANLISIMEEEIDQTFQSFKPEQDIDLYDLFHTLAFNIVAKTLFSSDIDENKVKELGKIITEVQEVFAKEVRLPFYSQVLKFLGVIDKTIKKSKRSKAIIQSVLDKRRSSGEEKNDLLDMLIQARYEDTQLPMSDEQLIDEMLILFIAGHETTANALSFIFFEISQNSKAEEKLKKEIAEEDEMVFTSESLMKKSFTLNIIKESMRLHSPAWAIDRQALENDSFKEYSWAKDTLIILYITGLHRNPKYWKDPNSFIPERFDDENAKNFAYYPFGAGPRLCIGEHFAMMEMALIVRKFYKNFSFISYQKELEKKALVTLRTTSLKGKITKDLI